MFFFLASHLLPSCRALPQVRAGRWSALYFVTYILFCATMMLDVLVGVVIEGFRVSTKGPQQEPPAARTDTTSEAGDGAMSSSSSVVDEDDEASLSGEMYILCKGV